MASPFDPLVKIEGLPAVNGPASVNAVMLDAIAATPYEGIWVPWLFVKQGSLEISGSFSTLSCQLYGTNAQNPQNSYTITITGSATNNDVITLNFITPTGVITVTFTVTTGLTVTQIAAGIVAAINTSLTATAYGFFASNQAGVVTLAWPSPSPFQGAGTWTTSSPPPAPVVTITSSVSGGATEVVTVTAGVGGSTIGSAITALGMTQFTISARWLKIRLTTLTGGGANVTAVAQGTA